MMNDVFEEIMARLTLKAESIRYINWNIGQMDGYYLKPSVTFPCVLISFDNVGYEDLGNLTQIATVNMQLKIVANSLSNTSNLTPEAVRLKGNEIWEIENEVFRALQGFSGLSFNTMTRKSARKEPHEEGYQIINSTYSFAKQDSTKAPVTTKKALIAEITPEFDLPSPFMQMADYMTFNSDSFLYELTTSGSLYGYSVVFAKYNGVTIDSNFTRTFASTSPAAIPVQEFPHITIPNHDENNEFRQLTYDRNFIDFLQSLEISSHLSFDTSPFGEGSSFGSDPGFPLSSLVNKGNPVNESSVYGEGFQIRWRKGNTFNIRIRYLYALRDLGDATVWLTGHTLEFTESNMNIDGAILPINVLEYVEVE